jgi:hypothetical protein
VRKRLLIGLVAAVALAGLVIAKRHELIRFAIERGAGFAGYAVRIADLRIGGDGATLYGVHVARAGQPVLEAGQISIRYSLRDLLPGSRHRFGLLGADVSGAKLTITRFHDGSYNVSLPSSPPQRVPQPFNPVPFDFWVRVHDARLVLREPEAYDPSAKTVRVRDINVDARINSAAVTHYRVNGAFEAQRAMPFTIAGRIDVIRGFAMHHAQAARFPLRALANYFADTPAVRILRGGARNFDARLYALGVTPQSPGSYHVSLRLDVDGGRLALQTLAAPVNDLHGRLHVVDNAFFVRDLRATLTGIPLRITGGVYDLTGALTGSPHLRLAVWGAGDMRELRHAFTFTRDQPIAGMTRLGVLVHGAIDDPVIVARADAPHASYRAIPFDALHANVVYHANVVALAPLQANYAGTKIGIRGTMVIGKKLHSLFAVHITGTANHLPYLDEMLDDEPFVVDASATGNDLLFHVAGALASARGVSRMAALFGSDPNGTAAVEPFWLHTERGDFDGGYLLDRPHDTSSFWVIANNLRMRPPSSPAFPGISLPQMPPVDSRNVAMTVAGGGSGTDVALAGIASAQGARIATVDFDRIYAAFGGTLQNAAVNVLHATGPWGRFDGAGDFSSTRLIAYGRYRGTFEGLQPFLGSAIPGHGAIAGTAAIAVQPNAIVVQGSNLAMRNATLRSIPISNASLTLAIEGDQLRIYSAHARAAGGDVVAAGTFSLAAPAAARGADALSLVANNLAAAQLRGIGLPLSKGRLIATGNLAAGAPVPSFNGGVSVAGGRLEQFDIGGNGDVQLAGNAAMLRRMVGQLGGTYAIVNGSIGSLTSGLPAFGLDANVPAGQIAGTLHAFGFPNYMTDGTFNAQLHVGGNGLAPNVMGRVGVPAGDVNGLPFIDASANLSASAKGVSVHHGRVLVGTTYAHFTAVSQPGEQAMHVSATHADLSDFNNFFDTGDTLDGDGRIKIAAASSGDRLTSTGNIDIRDFRYRNLPIGDTRASWSSERNVLTGSLAIGGSEGALRAHGSLGLRPSRDWRSTLEHTRFDLGAQVSDLDLSLWLPALGMQALPITGRASGTATVHGRYPFIDLSGNAGITDGTLGPLSLENAQLAVHSARGRIQIDRAEMTTPELAATASGSLGLGPDAPLDVQVHASTDRLEQLIYAVSRTRFPVSGSFESTLQVGGTYREPTFLAGFDATGVETHGFSIPSLFGEVRLHGQSLVLSDAGATFAHGQATLAGSLPLQLSPLRLAAPDQPISFDLDVVDLNPTIFAELLGNNTKLGGLINGHVGLSGTISAPVIVGYAALTNGSYVSDLERVGITQTVASLSFNHTSASIDRFSARLGSGTVQASGRIEFPAGFTSSAPSLNFNGVARGAQLDLPEFGSGTIDAKIALTKEPKADALLAGNVTLSHATLPFLSFLKAAQQGGTGLPPLPLAFDLHMTAGKNVRVRGSGYGAGLDIGTTGSVHLAGTLAAPTLSGSIKSTGGTLTYFDRAFRVTEGSVAFNPANGVVPTLHAVATTTVVNPDPDRARNPYGSLSVTINVDGPIQSPRVGFSSTPSGYTRDQIIGLIAPFGGFLNGIAFSRQSMLQAQSPLGITPLGLVSPIPNVNVPTPGSTISVGQEAFNLLNAQFTAGLLSPFESALGQGLGLTSVNLTLGYYGNVGVTATRLLGSAVSAVYAVTFGIPQIQSFGLQVRASETTSATMSFYIRSGPINLVTVPGLPLGYSSGYLLGQPLVGNSGFSLLGERSFW